MKNARQQMILELIEKYDIDTQETLIDKLGEVGFVATQTTVSRDIKQLKLVKGMTHKGTYKYIVPEAKIASGAPVLNSALTDSVIKIEAAENIVVVKTLPGMANAIGVCIDSLREDCIVGSVAGDDTMLIVVKTSEFAKSLETELKGVFSLK